MVADGRLALTTTEMAPPLMPQLRSKAQLVAPREALFTSWMAPPSAMQAHNGRGQDLDRQDWGAGCAVHQLDGAAV